MTDLHVENEIEIRASPSSIFSMAAAVERWPDILPHYRSVEVLGVRDGGKLTVMRAYRGRIPVRWSAITWIDAEVPRIRFQHTAGFTRGMAVEWRFEDLQPDAAGSRTRVVISHLFAARRPAVIWKPLNRLVALHFVDYIATRTLRRVKQVMETEEVMCAAE